MIQKDKSLREIERRAYRSTFQDGIYDIQFGVLILIFALIAVLESVNISRFYGYPLLILPIILSWLGKRLITIPRLGMVEFGPGRKSRRRLALLISVIVFLLTLPLMIMIIMQGVSVGSGTLVIALFAAPLIVIAAYAVDYPRMCVYAAFLFFAVLQSEFLYGYVGQPLNSLICFGLPGLIILAYGLTLFVEFLKKYPRQVPEADHVSR